MATPLSDGDPNWSAAWSKLEASVDACVPSRVGAAIDEWVACATHVVRQVPLQADGSGPSAEDSAVVWSEMHRLMRLVTRLNASTKPGVAACPMRRKKEKLKKRKKKGEAQCRVRRE